MPDTADRKVLAVRACSPIRWTRSTERPARFPDLPRILVELLAIVPDLLGIPSAWFAQFQDL